MIVLIILFFTVLSFIIVSRTDGIKRRWQFASSPTYYRRHYVVGTRTRWLRMVESKLRDTPFDTRGHTTRKQRRHNSRGVAGHDCGSVAHHSLYNFVFCIVRGLYATKSSRRSCREHSVAQKYDQLDRGVVRKMVLVFFGKQEIMRRIRGRRCMASTIVRGTRSVQRNEDGACGVQAKQ